MTQPDRLREAVHRGIERIVENELRGVPHWRTDLTNRLTDTAMSALAAPAPDLAGHRVDGPHDCFDMNCKALGHEVESLRALLRAAPSREAGLDAERLARALTNNDHTDIRGDDDWTDAEVLDLARAIAAEYARLSTGDSE